MILVTALLVLLFLGVVSAASAFYVNANLSAVQSTAHKLQTRLAAEAGIHSVMHMLRTQRDDVNAWYDDPERFHRIIVWSQNGGVEAIGTAEEFDDGSPAYRFSIVADNPEDDTSLVRYGVTDEASKLNINTASRDQLVSLISRFANEEDVVDELADALIDWRDRDIKPGEFGAEAEYYARLDPPYAVKNAPFDTVEELLLVRGFSGRFLYGEDFDRNGLLSPNEDDGDISFPPDDADGALNRGLYPFVTVFSRDINSASDNRPRVFLFQKAATVSEQLSEFTDDARKIEFIVGANASKPRIKSPAELLRDRVQKANPKGPEETIPSPLSAEDMQWVMDRCTTSAAPELLGLINVNTASAEVLGTLAGLDDEDVSALIQARADLPSEDKRSTGWVAQVLEVEKFIAIAPLITARSTRFRVDALGYGDHIGTVSRIEAVVEMRGPIGQVIYYRDLTTLGTAFPIRYAVGDSELAGFVR